MNTSQELLHEYARLLNAHGPDHPDVKGFYVAHRDDDPDFAMLARIWTRVWPEVVRACGHANS